MLAVAQDGVAVADALVTEVDIGRMVRPGARGNHDVTARQAHRLAVRRLHLERVCIDERRLSREDRHAVALVEAMTARYLRLDHLVGTREQLRVRQPRGVAELAQQRIATHVVQDLRGMAQGLAGDGAPVGAAAADFVVTLHQRDGAMVLGCGHGRALARGAAADHDYVELFHGAR